MWLVHWGREEILLVLSKFSFFKLFGQVEEIRILGRDLFEYVVIFTKIIQEKDQKFPIVSND